MNELTIKVELTASPELTAIISKLLGAPTAAQPVTQAVPQQTVQPQQTAPVQPQQTAPVQTVAPQNVMPMVTPQNVGQTQAVPQTVPQNVVQPTAAPTTAPAAPEYTLDQLGNAAAPLMASRQQDLLNLLAQFGVQALPQLPREQYGAFATALRGMGANI